jgi:hypothetical protein
MLRIARSGMPIFAATPNRWRLLDQIELLTDAEAHSLLAVGGDPDALAALASVADDLAGLRDTARAKSSRSGEH